jgi:hypothetical protein
MCAEQQGYVASNPALACREIMENPAGVNIGFTPAGCNHS